MASKADQSFVHVVLGGLKDTAKHDKFPCCVSQPNCLFVEIPEISSNDIKTPRFYAKKRRAFLSLVRLAEVSVVTYIPFQPDFQSLIKHLAPRKKHAEVNSSLLFDLFRQRHEEVLSQACERMANLRNACRLLNFWMDRNQPASTLGAFPHLALHLALVDACGHDEKVWSKASVIQLFRRALKWLVDSDLTSTSLVTRIGEPAKASEGFKDVDFLQAFRVCLVSLGVNLAHDVLASSYRLLQTQAARALAMQEDREAMLLFRGPSSPLERFDLLLRVRLPPSPSKEQHETWRGEFVRKAEALVEAALRSPGRVSEFGFFHLNSPYVVGLGLVVDPEKAFRLVDKGPPSEEDSAAAAFREFWGDRAELRRFKDGSVVEAAVWEDCQPRRHIPRRIVEHVLSLHLGQPVGVSLIGSSLDGDAVREDARSQRAIEQYTQLERKIRSVSGLPLEVQHVALVDAPSLRFARFVPSLSSESRCVQLTGELLVRFESTSRYPQEEEARKSVETVLLVELARGLEKGEDELRCRVSSERYVDVFAPGEVIFRVYLVRSSREREQDALLHSQLHSLHHSSLFGASRSFGPVCRLVKRWVSGQRFSSVLSDRLVDVLVASLFTRVDPPRSGLCGLLRFFDLLSTFDFTKRPLLVNLEEPYGLDFARRNRADACFFKLRENGRRGGPPLVLYVFSSSTTQEEEVVFPDAALVDAVSWSFVTQRAAASKLFLEKLCSVEEEKTEVRLLPALFASDARLGFDAVLWLEAPPSLMRNGGGGKKIKYQNLVPLHVEDEVLVGLNVVGNVVASLREEFGSFALFFTGEDDSSIGVVWKYTKPFPFTIANTKFAMPAREEGFLEINKRELLDAMVCNGSGIIVSSDIIQ